MVLNKILIEWQSLLLTLFGHSQQLSKENILDGITATSQVNTSLRASKVWGTVLVYLIFNAIPEVKNHEGRRLNLENVAAIQYHHSKKRSECNQEHNKIESYFFGTRYFLLHE